MNTVDRVLEMMVPAWNVTHPEDVANLRDTIVEVLACADTLEPCDCRDCTKSLNS